MRSKNDWWNYLEHRLKVDNELYHYGVLGMHWGIRRYQSYSTVPRKSGKGGKELGAAKESNNSEIGTAAEVFNSLSKKEKSNLSTSSKYSNSPTLVRRSIQKDKNGHAIAYAEIERDPEDSGVGYISVAVDPKYRGQGLSEKVSRDVLEDIGNSGLRNIYWETTKDNPASSATAKKLGFESAKNFSSGDDNYVLELDHQSKYGMTWGTPTDKIKFKEASMDNITGFNDKYYKGETSFGGNSKCLVTIEKNSDKAIVDKIMRRSVENTMRDHASEMYKYETLNPNGESKEVFRKRLKCDQISVNHVGDPNIVSVWYNHPDDSGAWYMEVDSRTGKIKDEQYYR